MQRVRLVVVGIVQGVGFRPYIHRLVTEFNLKGWIRNESYGVELELEGTSQAIEGFVARLKAQPPRLAVIEALRVESCGALKNYAGFTIRASEKRGESMNEKAFAETPSGKGVTWNEGEVFRGAQRLYRFNLQPEQDQVVQPPGRPEQFQRDEEEPDDRADGGTGLGAREGGLGF